MGDAVILLVELFPCNSEDEARAREAHYILNNECVNRNIPNRTHKESYKNWLEKNNDCHKEYYETNKEEYKKNVKEYNEANKEKIAEYKKKYYRQKKLKQANLSTDLN